MFPRDFGQIFRYAINRAPQVLYQFSYLPVFLPWLVRYFLASSPERALHSAMAELPLIRRSLIEHEALCPRPACRNCCGRTGWLKLFLLRANPGQRRTRPRSRQALRRRWRSLDGPGDCRRENRI